jgi:cytochrome c
MKARHTLGAAFGIALSVALLSIPGTASAVDAEGAKALMKKSDCTKCHAVDKDKKGPAYQKVAAKYKGKADAEDRLIKFITTPSKVKLPDGTEEEHRTLPAKDAKEVKNVVQWILAS